MKWWHSLKYYTRIRIVFIIGLIWLIDYCGYVSYVHNNSVQSYEYEVGKLRQELSFSETERLNNLQLYTERLNSIISHVHSQDYGIGGYGSLEGEELERLYASILNATMDYKTLVKISENYFDKRSDYLRGVPSIWPVRYDDSVRITSGFGDRYSPITRTVLKHKGID